MNESWENWITHNITDLRLIKPLHDLLSQEISKAREKEQQKKYSPEDFELLRMTFSKAREEGRQEMLRLEKRDFQDGIQEERTRILKLISEMINGAELYENQDGWDQALEALKEKINDSSTN